MGPCAHVLSGSFQGNPCGGSTATRRKMSAPAHACPETYSCGGAVGAWPPYCLDNRADFSLLSCPIQSVTYQFSCALLHTQTGTTLWSISFVAFPYFYYNFSCRVRSDVNPSSLHAAIFGTPPQYMSARGSLFPFAWNVAGYKNSSAGNHAHASRASKISSRDAGLSDETQPLHEKNKVEFSA